MSTGYLGTVLKARPALLRWQDSPVTRAAISLRWLGWVADGWRLTTVAALTFLTVVGFSAPWLLALSAVAGAWATVGDRQKTTAALVGAVSLVGAVWWTWTQADTLLQLSMVAMLGVWPVDALVGAYDEKWRMRRWWCELRRGFPIRYAIMAMKATQIQGVMGGERQLIEGRRPILDHPAISRRVTFDGNQAWALCSVPPGRDVTAFKQTLEELAASFVNVQRMDLVFADDYQTYGYLVVTFGPPLLNTAVAPQQQTRRLSDIFYAATPHAGLTVALAAVIWTGLT